MKRSYLIIKKNKIIFIMIIFIFLLAGLGILYIRKNPIMPQAAFYFLNDVPSAKPAEKILVFSPHPDDETIALGGYIYEASKAGANISIVLVTDGNKHGIKDKRYQEFKTATSILGVKNDHLIFLNYPDGGLKKIPQEELFANFGQEISEINPNLVFYPSLSDTHQDHATVGKVVQRALKDYPAIKSYQYLVHNPRFPQPKKYLPNMYLLPPNDLVQFDNEWQKFSLTPDAEKAKYQAIQSYKSQLRNPLLKNIFYGSVRQNELFSIGAK